jgi:hypothetical protein
MTSRSGLADARRRARVFNQQTFAGELFEFHWKR